MQARGEDTSNPITVLIGGWAVYSYNPWYGSIDIDLVTNNKTRHSLIRYLRDERKFIPLSDPMRRSTVIKEVAGGEILIDFVSREDPCLFEGRLEKCPFSLLNSYTEVREILPGFSVIVPKQTLLMIFKLKAAWDRLFRLENGISSRSNNEEWEKAKLRKDRADILSLIDPNVQGREIDIQYLGNRLQEYSFLVETLRKISDDKDAIDMYRRMNRREAKESIETLLQLTLDERR